MDYEKEDDLNEDSDYDDMFSDDDLEDDVISLIE